MERPAEPARLLFAQHLRGIAAVSVLAAHLAALNFVAPSVAAGLLMVPPLPPQDVPWFAKCLVAIPSFNFGPFGVALFFLISGFVIPFSLARERPVQFLVSRFFRIWPTYIAGLSIGLFALATLHFWLGSPFPHSIPLILANAVILVRDWLHLPQIDHLVWTLEIETKFYLLMALLVLVFGRISFAGVLAIACTLTFFTLVLGLVKDSMPATHLMLYRTFYVIAFAAPFLTVMLIGVLFKLYIDGSLSLREGGIAFFVFSGVMVPAQMIWGVVEIQTAIAVLPSYAVALGVFSVGFILRDKAQKNMILDWCATRSYPLYVVHPLVGYGLLYALAGLSPWLSLAITIITVFVLANLLHHLVEEPTRQLGKQCARKIKT